MVTHPDRVVGVAAQDDGRGRPSPRGSHRGLCRSASSSPAQASRALAALVLVRHIDNIKRLIALTLQQPMRLLEPLRLGSTEPSDVSVRTSPRRRLPLHIADHRARRRSGGVADHRHRRCQRARQRLAVPNACRWPRVARPAARSPRPPTAHAASVHRSTMAGGQGDSQLPAVGSVACSEVNSRGVAKPGMGGRRHRRGGGRFRRGDVAVDVADGNGDHAGQHSLVRQFISGLTTRTMPGVANDSGLCAR